MKRALAILLLALALIACGSSTANTGTAVTPAPTTQATTQPTDTPTPTPTPTPVTHFTVGQVVKVNDIWEITVLSAKNGGTADYLKAGQVFLDVEVKAVNISSVEQSMNPFSWTIRDTDGNTYDAGYDPNASTTISGKVEPGQPLKGSLTYAVSAKAHHYILLFAPDFTGSGQVIWDITV